MWRRKKGAIQRSRRVPRLPRLPRLPTSHAEWNPALLVVLPRRCSLVDKAALRGLSKIAENVARVGTNTVSQLGGVQHDAYSYPST